MAYSRSTSGGPIVAEYKIIWSDNCQEDNEEITNPEDYITITGPSTAATEVLTPTVTQPSASSSTTTSESASIGAARVPNNASSYRYTAHFAWCECEAVFSCSFSSSEGADRFGIISISETMNDEIHSDSEGEVFKNLVFLSVADKDDDDDNGNTF